MIRFALHWLLGAAVLRSSTPSPPPSAPLFAIGRAIKTCIQHIKTQVGERELSSVRIFQTLGRNHQSLPSTRLSTVMTVQKHWKLKTENLELKKTKNRKLNWTETAKQEINRKENRIKNIAFLFVVNFSNQNYALVWKSLDCKVFNTGGQVERDGCLVMFCQKL